jgi:hypothetical protein
MILRLSHKQIDKTKWDTAIYEADTNHVYLLSWYLDIVSPNWEAYVWGDYKYIMPLPVKYKYGIPYLVQPDFCQQIGIFGIGVSKLIAKEFYKKLYWQFFYVNIQIENFCGLENHKYLNGRINYTLNLSPSHEVLKRDYNGNAIRNIKKAKKPGLVFQNCSPSQFMDFFSKHGEGSSNKLFDELSKILEVSYARKLANIYGVCSEDGELLAAGIFVSWNWQLVYLAGASSSKGKELSAMFLMFDSVIGKFAETGWLLDFEGSMIPGVAKFFKGFGGKSGYYYTLKKYLFLYR